MTGRGRKARRDPPCRRFTLGDAAIVAAGLAASLYLARDQIRGAIDPAPFAPRYELREVYRLAGIALVFASATVLILRFRRPRPTLRRVAGQPGAVACFGLVVALIANDCMKLTIVLPAWKPGDYYNEGWDFWVSIGDPATAGIVPVGWLLLLAGGRWRPEAGWIDRAGRVVGWGWIAWMIAGWFEFHFSDG